MATANGYSTGSPLPNSQIQAMQSVVPLKVTKPRLTRRVKAAGSASAAGLRRCLHIVLYYRKASGEDSGWLLAGWMKESLGRALEEQPMLAGRLRRGENVGPGNELEIVTNDNGARLFEARISKTLDEFLDLEGRESAEAELVSWHDIDDQNPQFSPLFYVQVTNFSCGGYSVGISSSLLLSSPLAIISFLKKWAKIHHTITFASHGVQPIFFFPTFKSNLSVSDVQNGSNKIKTHGRTLIFRTANEKLNSNGRGDKALVSQCVEEAEILLGKKVASEFLLVKELPVEVRVENFTKGLLEKPESSYGISRVSWDELGAREVAFNEGNKPVQVSCWINSVLGEGLVMVIPSSDEDISPTNVIVSVPDGIEM
ncbi:unnamed protein product [Thlaspi arvense]|uniref:Uncharacterized protein n=1 Tax=Thlaspi arvense TaxID=13288 RepID=A0AAU9T0P1_THLAR|nr:unnamed protein product [Thlaspi arvense]